MDAGPVQIPDHVISQLTDVLVAEIEAYFEDLFGYEWYLDSVLTEVAPPGELDRVLTEILTN